MSTAPGAYGLRFPGLAEGHYLRDVLVDAPGHWPALSLEQRIEDPPPTAPAATADSVRIELADGGHALLERERRAVTFLSPEPVEADGVVHPTLAAVAAIFSHWLGRQAIHAGGFVVEDGVWALIGDKQAGKSSTLGWLAQAGNPILADDLMVIEDGTAFAGPRTLDLQPSSTRYLGRDGHLVRGGERHRVALEGVDPEVPLRGWIALSWGDVLEARRLPPGERVGVLIEHLRIRADGAGSGSLLDLAALPGFELRRPRQLAELPHTGAKVVELASSCPG